MRNYSKNGILILSRPTGKLIEFESFTVLNLQSLTEEQKSEFMSCPSVSLEEVEITAHEHFNRGLKFGVMMMLEIFGKKPIDKDI